jgi:hypothetical protein
MSADQPHLRHANNAQQPLILFAAAIIGQTVAGRMTQFLTQEELMQ